ncbi:MAG: YqaE/Pmp3 family membrane protein [Fluviicola sp.]|nr:YqaE/Pmp3 family membrane protein [Fluviicola sp.]
MKKLHLFASALIITILVSSCGVAGNGFGGSSIQKRKYTKGFYHNKNRGFKASDDKVVTGELIVQEDAKDEAVVSSLEKKEVQSTVFQSDKVIKNEQPQPQQRSDEKSTQKKKGSTAKKETKPAQQVRQRKQREHEYYVPLSERATIAKKAAQGSSESGVMLVLLVILAIIIPPLAVAIYEGITTRFWIDLILAIVGFGIGFAFFGFGLAYLCGLAAVIYALLIVLGVI